MANPTAAEAEAILKQVVKIWDEQRKRGHVNSSNLIGEIDTLQQLYEGDFIELLDAAIARVRGAHAASMEECVAAGYWALRIYARALEFPETDPQGILDRLQDYYVANSKTVNSREFTFGTPSAGVGNVGTGTLNRLTKNEDNKDLENNTADDKIVRCIEDRQSRAPLGQEVFEIYGETALRDRIQTAGSGERGRIVALSCVDALRYFGNPSFDNFSGTAAVPTAINDWTLTTGPIGTTVIFDGTNYYRTFEGAGTPYSLKFQANETLSQYFYTRKATFNPRVPVYVQIAYNRSVGSGDGTLTLTFGSKTASVVLAAQSGWNILRITVDDDLWLKNFNGTTPVLSIALSGRTTGTVLVDDLIVGEMTYFDGSWYAAVGGATPFKRLDSFTFSDTIATDGKINAFLDWAFDRFLHHTTGGTETVTDPS